jgi:hypothetical protein
MARYEIWLAVIRHILLHDRRFQATVITGAIGTAALASITKNNRNWSGSLVRSSVIQGMGMLAVTWENAKRDKSALWLHAAVRRGHLAVR